MGTSSGASRADIEICKAVIGSALKNRLFTVMSMTAGAQPARPSGRHEGAAGPGSLRRTIMKLEQSIFVPGKGWQVLPDSDNVVNPQLVLFFGSNEFLATDQHYENIRNLYPNADIVGCSTAGEILGSKTHDDTVVASAIEFENSESRVATLLLSDVTSSYHAGASLGARLARPDLQAVIVVSDGINVNGSDLVRGMMSTVGQRVPISGGLAGDADRFAETLVACNGSPEKGRIAAIGLYGESIQVGHGSVGGWTGFGPQREITKSEGNVLFELDGRPALDLYKTYLGDEAANLPSSALNFPLMVRSPGQKCDGLVRTILAIDEEARSMTFAGDVPQGHSAQLMHANIQNLIDGAASAAQEAMSLKPNGRQLALLVSCVGRKIVLGERASEEVEAVTNLVGSATARIGYYSYGEISPAEQGGFSELHNQTMTITLLTEHI